MVLIKNPIKSAILPLAIGSLMFLDGCKKDEPAVAPPSKTDLLVGDWEINELGDWDLSSTVYSYLFKFQKSGDWQFCYENANDPSQNDCYLGKWRWKDANETTIIMEQNSSPDEDLIIDIVILDETKLEGTFTYTGSSYDQTITLIKVQ